MPAYILTAPKLKLNQTADPGLWVTRTDANSPILLNGSSVPSRTTKFHNISLAQFAGKRQFLAGTYFHAPVPVATGLESVYD